MNRIAQFFHELRNPHCQHCIDEKNFQMQVEVALKEKELDFSREQQELDRTCDSCENLKLMNAQLLDMNRSLLERIGNQPVVEKITTHTDFTPIRPAFIPPSVRRNMLERQDRKLAKQSEERALNDAAKPDPTETKIFGLNKEEELESIEKELEDVAGTEKTA